MIEPLSAVTGTISIVQGVAQFYKFLQAQGDKVISAYFDANGKLLYGDDSIKINVHRENDNAPIWWFEVKPIEGYEFVRAPVIETGIFELTGQKDDATNPDARFWRWISPPRPGVIVDGRGPVPNILVNFLVVGYRPSELLKRAG